MFFTEDSIFFSSLKVHPPRRHPARPLVHRRRGRLPSGVRPPPDAPSSRTLAYRTGEVTHYLVHTPVITDLNGYISPLLFQVTIYIYICNNIYQVTIIIYINNKKTSWSAEFIVISDPIRWEPESSSSSSDGDSCLDPRKEVHHRLMLFIRCFLFY